MTIRSFAPGALAANRAADTFVAMRRDLDDMQRRLATGKIADSYAGLGFERRSSLDMRGKMAMLSGYQTTIDNGTLRLKLMAQVAERLDGMARETRSDLMSPPFDIGSDGRSVPQRLAEQRMREALDQLNKDLNGRHLFAGRSPEAAPVETYDRIMNGDGVNAGLKQVLNERTAAEVGFDGLGRLSLSPVTSAVPATPPFTMQLTGNGAGFPFGFEIVSANATGANVAGSGAAAGAPEQVTLTVSGQLADNNKITIVLRDKDNATHTIELTAKTLAAPTDRSVFQIGADAEATAANLRSAVETAIRDKATAVLKPRAAMLAAEEFFEGSNATDPARVAASPPRVASSYVGPDTLRLTEDLSALGFEVTGVTSTTAGATSTPNVGPPPRVDLQFTAPPADGETVTVTLEDRNNVVRTVVLTARTTPTGPNEFELDAGSIANSINGPNGLRVAVQQALDAEAAAALGADEATAMDTSGARPTLIWYKGDDAALSSPLTIRDGERLRVDASQTVGVGARANEDAIKAFLAPLGVLSAVTFTDTPAERERYTNLMADARDMLSPPQGEQRLEEIITDFGAAMATMDAAKARHKVATNMLQDVLDSVEQASTEETAAAMLELQTRLQASYQTTAMLSRLSLVNFL